MVAFVGVGNTVVDLFTHLRNWLYRPVHPKKRPGQPQRHPAGHGRPGRGPATSPNGAIGDWASVLHYRSDAGLLRPGRGPVSRRASRRRAAGAGRPGRTPSRSSPSSPSSSRSSSWCPARSVGYEALTRFADGTSPQLGLAAAQAQGVHIDLDAALIRAAMASANALQDGTWLSVNVSSDLLRRPARAGAAAGRELPAAGAGDQPTPTGRISTSCPPGSGSRSTTPAPDTTPWPGWSR